MLKSLTRYPESTLANPLPVITVVWFVYFHIRSEFPQIQGLQTRPLLLEFSGSYILFNLRFSRSAAVLSLKHSLLMITHCPSIVNSFFTFFGFFNPYCFSLLRLHEVFFIITNSFTKVNTFFGFFQSF